MKSAGERYYKSIRGILKIINADGFLGGGNTKLISLGTLKKRNLYYNFRVFGLQDSGNTIILNFYLGEEVNNG